MYISRTVQTIKKKFVLFYRFFFFVAYFWEPSRQNLLLAPRATTAYRVLILLWLYIFTFVSIVSLFRRRLHLLYTFPTHTPSPYQIKCRVYFLHFASHRYNFASVLYFRSTRRTIFWINEWRDSPFQYSSFFYRYFWIISYLSDKSKTKIGTWNCAKIFIARFIRHQTVPVPNSIKPFYHFEVSMTIRLRTLASSNHSPLFHSFFSQHSGY